MKSRAATERRATIGQQAGRLGDDEDVGVLVHEA